MRLVLADPGVRAQGGGDRHVAGELRQQTGVERRVVGQRRKRTQASTTGGPAGASGSFV